MNTSFCVALITPQLFFIPFTAVEYYPWLVLTLFSHAAISIDIITTWLKEMIT